MQPSVTSNCDAPTAVNLGTVYYEMRDFERAAACYTLATKAEPNYPLAWFNLGNALDELQRRPEAIEAYGKAVELGHADAYYNLALLLEKMGERRKALKHYRAYLRTDRKSVWAMRSMTRARTILRHDPLQIVTRYGAPACKMQMPPASAPERKQPLQAKLFA